MDHDPANDGTLPPSSEQRIDWLCLAFEGAWKWGKPPAIEQFLAQAAETDRPALLRKLLQIDRQHRRPGDRPATWQDYLASLPGDMETLRGTSQEADGPVGETIAAPLASPAFAGQQMAPKPVDLPEIPGHEVLQVLGRGGMGLVLLARHHVLGRIVAVKLPLAAHCIDETDRERFLREARAAAGLRHPNICPLYEVGQAGDRPYITMAFIEGRTLAQWAEEHPPSGRQAAEMVLRLARAVEHAHGHGILHRDIKPSNVMVEGASGQPVLMDFGLAKELALEDSDLTQSGQVVGTPAYMAPEQAGGHLRQVGTHSDVYALGAVLYYLLCGRPPFVGNTGEVIRQVQTDEPPPPRRLAPRIHRDLETICLKAMAKGPKDRYAGAADLAGDLERFSAGEPILARRRGPLVRTWRLLARRPLLSALLAAAVLILAVSGMLLVRGYHERQIAGLLTSLEEQFDAGQWSDEGLATMDATIGRIERWSGEQAAASRARLAARLAADIEEHLKQPRLEGEHLAQVESWLGLLEPRDRPKAAELKGALRRRLTAWQPVFELTPPFANLDTVFAHGRATADGKGLARAGPTESPLIGTGAPSTGVVRLEAVFAAGWEDGSFAGLVLDASGGPAAAAQPPGKAGVPADPGGYCFLLRTPAGNSPAAALPGPGGSSFAAARRNHGTLIAEIFRGTTCLRREQLGMEELPNGPLRLAVSRAGDELRFEVGPLPPLEFWDPSPRGSQPGQFAVYWPAGARLRELRALRRPLPETHSPLEAGDELCAAGQFGEAIEAYRRQVQTFGSAETGQEARYKQAVCLLALGRQSEADALLAEVAAGSAGRWALLAACRLWLRRVTQGQIDEADAVFDTLVVRHRVQSVAALVPYTLQSPIIRAYCRQRQGLNLYRVDSRLPRQCRRALEIMEFFEVPDDTRDFLQFAIVRAHRAVGQEAEALEAAAGFLQPPSAGKRERGCIEGGPTGLVSEYTWLLRAAGRPKTALAEIERFGNLRLGELRGAHAAAWTVKRVRCLWAAGRFSEAEAALDSLQDRCAAADWENIGISAWLLKGFLRRRAGDDAGAPQAWKKAAGLHWLDVEQGFRLTDGLIAASLSGSFTEADAKAALAILTASAGEDPNLMLMQTSLGELVWQPKTIVTVANNLFRNRWGEGLARKFAFREMPLRDCLRVIPSLGLYELLRESAMPPQLPDEQAELLWKLSNDGYTAAVENHAISKAQFLQLGLAWKGITNVLGWAGVAPTLPPDLRGAIAYVLGHRYLRLGRPEDAAGLFRTAAADAPAGLPLRKLAEAELQRLAKPPLPLREKQRAE